MADQNDQEELPLQDPQISSASEKKPTSETSFQHQPSTSDHQPEEYQTEKERVKQFLLRVRL